MRRSVSIARIVGDTPENPSSALKVKCSYLDCWEPNYVSIIDNDSMIRNETESNNGVDDMFLPGNNRRTSSMF